MVVLLQLKEENTSMANKDTDKDLGTQGVEDTVVGSELQRSFTLPWEQ
jgi:hypothetical protein